MKMNMRRFVLLTGFLFSQAACLLLAQAALAQGMIPTNRDASARPVVPTAPPPPRREMPPGLPGARVDEDTVAPSDRPAAEMRPTEALFDAINRGDISAARDAINRGAELNARSILGMTPLDLAIDLARKDIAFLLLSLRGSDDRPAPRAGVASNTRAPNRAQPAEAPQATRQPPRPNGTQSGIQSARVAPTPGPAAPQGARLFAGDGGTPAPDAGFLGFDGGRARPR